MRKGECFCGWKSKANAQRPRQALAMHQRLEHTTLGEPVNVSLDEVPIYVPGTDTAFSVTLVGGVVHQFRAAKCEPHVQAVRFQDAAGLHVAEYQRDAIERIERAGQLLDTPA